MENHGSIHDGNNVEKDEDEQVAFHASDICGGIECYRVQNSGDSVSPLILSSEQTRRRMIECSEKLRLAFGDLTKGVKVYVLLPHSLELVIVVLSLLHLGAVYIPIGSLTDWTSSYLITLFNSDLTKGEQTRNPHHHKSMISKGEVFLKAHLYQRESPLSVSVPFRCAYIIHTSGTISGSGTQVHVELRTFLDNVRSIQYRLGANSNDNFILVSAPVFDPSLVEIMLPLLCGGKLVVLEDDLRANCIYSPPHPEALFEIIKTAQVSHLMMTPSLFATFSTSQRTSLLRGSVSDSSAVRDIVLGGEAFPADLIPQCQRSQTPVQLWNIYGTTECSVWATLFKIPSDWPHPDRIPIGSELDQTTAFILVQDDQSDLLDLNATGINDIRSLCESMVFGSIYLGGVNRKYLVGSETSLVPVRDTGDIGYELDGLIYVVYQIPLGRKGRNDDQVKRLGNRVSLSRLSGVLMNEVHYLSQCVALLIPGSHLLVVFACCHQDVTISSTIIKSDIYQACKSRFPYYYLPNVVVVYPGRAMPITVNGKVDKKSLLNYFNQTQEQPERERLNAGAIREIIYNTLQIPVSENHDDHTFTNLGGTSLSAAALSYDMLKYRYTGLDASHARSKHNTLYRSLLTESIGDFCRDAITILQRHEGDVEKLFHQAPNAPNPHELTQTPLPKLNVNTHSSYDIVSRGMISQNLPESFCESIRQGKVSIKWQVHLCKCVDASPLIVVKRRSTIVSPKHDAYEYSHCYIASHSGYFYCINNENGKIRWKQWIGRSESSASFDPNSGLVWVGSYEGCMFGIDAISGAVRVEFPSGGIIKCEPTLDAEYGVLWFGNYAHTLFTLKLPSAKDLAESLGKIKAESLMTDVLDGSIFAAVRIARQLVLACTTGGCIYGYDRRTLARHFQLPLACPIFSTPAVYEKEIGCADGTNIQSCSLYITVGGVDGWLYGITVQQSNEGGLIDFKPSISWRVNLSGPIFTNPCIVAVKGESQHQVWVGCHGGGGLWKIDMCNGMICSHDCEIGAQFATPFSLDDSSSDANAASCLIGLMYSSVVCLVDEVGLYPLPGMNRDVLLGKPDETVDSRDDSTGTISITGANHEDLLFSSPVQYGPWVWVGGRSGECLTCWHIG